MIQFNIYALDYTDADALNRRMAVRPAHLEGVKKLKDTGNFIKTLRQLCFIRKSLKKASTVYNN